MPEREYDGHTLETDPRRHIYQRISNNVSYRNAGFTFSVAEVRDVISDASNSTGVPKVDHEIRKEAGEYGISAGAGA